jgi:hypothetical protein
MALQTRKMAPCLIFRANREIWLAGKMDLNGHKWRVNGRKMVFRAFWPVTTDDVP